MVLKTVDTFYELSAAHRGLGSGSFCLTRLAFPLASSSLLARSLLPFSSWYFASRPRSGESTFQVQCEALAATWASFVGLVFSWWCEVCCLLAADGRFCRTKVQTISGKER